MEAEETEVNNEGKVDHYDASQDMQRAEETAFQSDLDPFLEELQESEATEL